MIWVFTDGGSSIIILISFTHCHVGLVPEQFGSDSDVASKIKQLEKQFKSLHKRTREELMTNKDINVQEMLHAITLLPIKLKNEYETAISEKLPKFPREGSISELFLHLNPLFSFIDYGLLEYIIEEFGSNSLKINMQSYCGDVHAFMKQTTVQQLIDYWPSDEEVAPNVSKVIASINKDPRSCNLHELDTLRRKICIRARLSDVVQWLVSRSHSLS